jgi:putative ABC transport system permease protein
MAGGAVTLALAQVLRGFLFGVSATDPLSIGLATVAVITTAAIAAYLPARVLTRVDLIAQLRR